MNKSGFIKELSNKLGYEEEKCILINSVLDDTFLVGKNNKEKIIADLIEKVGVDAEEADKIYNTVMEIFKNNVKDKILHPFKRDNN